MEPLCKHVEEQELPYIEKNVFGLVLLWGSEVRLWKLWEGMDHMCVDGRWGMLMCVRRLWGRRRM